jgi:hypothetical protein
MCLIVLSVISSQSQAQQLNALFPFAYPADNIPLENLDAIAQAKWDKPMMVPQGSVGGGGSKSPGGSEADSKGHKGAKGDKIRPSVAPGKEEVQNIYNNLSNLMVESTEHKNLLEVKLTKCILLIIRPVTGFSDILSFSLH